MTLTLMEQEALQSPQVLEKQFTQNHALIKKMAERIRLASPKIAITIARGSSDNAATFAKYLFETRAGLITSSAAPSVFTLYKKQLPFKDCLVIGISQSGASPDVAEMLSAARKVGAVTVAIVNHADSPLANAAEFVLPIFAGDEKAVAATKTYLATLAALIQLIAEITQDAELQKALNLLPKRLEEAASQDWSAAVTEYQYRHNTYVIARGYGYPIAQEAALKFKETSKIHAESFSGAELMHGPFALIENKFPILMLAQQDETLSGMLSIAERMKKLGADVMLALPENGKQDFQNAASLLLPMPKSLHPVCDPLLNIQAFYMMAARLSVARGFNPDAPDNLSKVTHTW